MNSNVVWNSKTVEETIEKIRMGIPTNTSCFFNQDPELKASNIAFQFSEWEEEEFVRCSSDIEYFVENYCKFLTDQGLRTVELREYQRKILNTLGEEEWLDNIEEFSPKVRDAIVMSARQSGKCLSFNTLIKVRNKKSGNTFDIEIGKFFMILDKLKRKRTLKQKFIDSIKLFLYKIYHIL